MFWGCFAYDKKGPCHIWKDETAAEKLAYKTELDRRNALRVKSDKAKWNKEQKKAAITYKRKYSRAKPGKTATWVHNEKNGTYIRIKGTGGIDWWRYQQTIHIPKLFPFVKKCIRSRPKTVIQEDKAPSCASHYQDEILNLWKLTKLLWCGNSPDINAIEPTWNWMKRQTTIHGSFTSKIKIEEAWLQCWKDLPQKTIQKWIERIPIHVKEIIRLEGGNQYKEGRLKGIEKKTVH